MALRARNASPRGRATLNPQSTCHGPRPGPNLAHGVRAGSLRATERRAQEKTRGRKRRKCRRAKKHIYTYRLVQIERPKLCPRLMTNAIPNQYAQIWYRRKAREKIKRVTWLDFRVRRWAWRCGRNKYQPIRILVKWPIPPHFCNISAGFSNFL